MAQLLKQFIRGASFLLILILSTNSIFGQKSKKKSTTTTKAKTTTTTTTKTTTTVEKKPLETKVSAEEQAKQDISLAKKLVLAIKSDTLKAHNVSGVIIKRYISNEDGKWGADVLEITDECNQRTKNNEVGNCSPGLPWYLTHRNRIAGSTGKTYQRHGRD